MSETIISSTKAYKNNNIVPGAINKLSPIELNVEPILSNPTILVVNYIDNGVVPTGNNVSVYRLSSPRVQLPIIGAPVVDLINRTLTVVVAPGYINVNDSVLVEFETIIV